MCSLLKDHFATFQLRKEIVMILCLLNKLRQRFVAIFKCAHKATKLCGQFILNHWFCESESEATATGTLNPGNSLLPFGLSFHDYGNFHPLYQEQGFTILAQEDILAFFSI